MLFKDDNDKPPTSKDEAWARRVRPPPEKYDPDKFSYWSITETLAWIIWRDLDAVRNQRDDYREKCADWKFERDPRARALADRLAIDKITGQIAPSDPDLQKKIQEKLQEHSWQLREWGRSGWNTLRASEHMRPQVAIDELWKAAGEGRIKAIALECKNAKAFDGNQVKIPARHWAYLTRDSDPSGKPILSGPDRVYREVRFLQLDVKKLWPKSPENVRIVPARKGRPPEYDWDDGMNYAKGEFERRGDFNDPQNAEEGWRSQADLVRLVQSYMAKHNGGKEPSESEVKRHLKDLLDSIRK